MTPAPTMQTRSTLPREYLSAVTCQSNCLVRRRRLRRSAIVVARIPEAQPLTRLRSLRRPDDSTAAILYPRREPAELGVADQPALLRPRPLHRVEQCRTALLGHVETELLDLDPDRVESALLPQHDAAFGADELGCVRLDRGRVVELRGDRAGLAREKVQPGHGLPRRERGTGQLLDERPDRSDLREA